ncbi:MAG TPA: hypothetical protein VE988_29335 [Gemmataceae bacterium]|nr:hypothetical protein [Gemmataceae bacterium]
MNGDDFQLIAMGIPEPPWPPSIESLKRRKKKSREEINECELFPSRPENDDQPPRANGM